MTKCSRQVYLRLCEKCFTCTYKCKAHGCHRCYNDKNKKFKVAKLNFHSGEDFNGCFDVSYEHGVGCTRHKEHGGDHGNFWRNPPVRWKKRKEYVSV